MTQQEALEAVRQATTDYVAAVETETFDDEEMDWLEWLQRRAARRALDVGCPVDAIKAALIEGVEEVQECTA